MKVAYWVVAGVLAAMYLYSGAIKTLQSKDQLRPMIAWVDSVSLPLLRTIGVLEVLGALGLILPPLTGIATGLALAAATGLLVIQILATGLHLKRGEAKVVPFNVLLLVLAGIAMWLSTVWF